MRKLQKLLILFAFILLAAHLVSLPAPASPRSGSESVTPAAKEASSEKIANDATRLPGHVLAAIKGATPVPASPGAASEPLTLAIVLKRTDQAGFDSYLHDVYDPNSPTFRHFLKQNEIADTFGPTRQEYEQVLNYLSARGFNLVEGSANRLTLTVTGTRAQAESAFALHIGDYKIGDRQFYANDKDPAVPVRIASSIQAVAGLSNLAVPRNESDAIAKAQKAFVEWWKSLTPVINKMQAATGGSNLQPDPPGFVQPDGTGQTVGLIEFDTFQLSDVANFLTLIGAPPTQISKVSEVKVNGGAALGPNQSEVLLDIDAVLSVSPGANVVVYDAPFTGPGVSFQTLFNAAINGGSTVISNSWAYCEDQTTLADVQSIDSILQAAAAAGIGVFNGAGDTGSTCLDGSANTVAVPADSPNATAVGGSSSITGPGDVYGTETWWDGTLSTPPTGQGGFGVSKFFTAPSYQVGLTTSAMRSVPDVVVNADPAYGYIICQASAGGCPNGQLWGGTSVAAPIWAGFAAVLNQTLGHNIGTFNQSIYPFANTSAFHNAASIGSDFAHVGLGSPNVDQLYLKLSGTTVGIPDATLSRVTSILQTTSFSALSPPPLNADGITQNFVNVVLMDANGNPVPGKTVTLSANTGSHVQISPPTAVTTLSNGTATFTLTDLVPEAITLTATDTTDNIQLTNTATSTFLVPPAAGAGINALPTTVSADGVSTTSITLTLQDALGRPTPGKLVTLSQGLGHSVISGPNPSITDVNGQISFTAVDQVAELVTYAAIDVTDGNLPFPATAQVTFTASAVSNGCGNGNPIAAPGFLITPYATGFVSQNYFYGDINNTGCPGAFGVAFDPVGNLYVSDQPTGNIYKFPPGGGVAGSATLLSAGSSVPSAGLGPSVGGLAVDKNGNLFAGRSATTGIFTTGAVLQIDTTTGAVRTVAGTGSSGIVGGLALTCPESIVIDPLTEDLFTDDSCGGAGSDNASMWRVSNPSSVSPVTSVYATFPGTPNATIAAAPSGTFYAWNVTGSSVTIQKVSATNGPATPTVTTVSGLPVSVGYLGLLAGGTQPNGDANFLVLNYTASGSIPGGIGIIDLTTTPPSMSPILVNNGVVSNNNFTLGPDGCVYAGLGNAVFKITDESGACNYTALQPTPAIALSPALVLPNPVQGTSQTFTAALHHVTAQAGVPVFFEVTGANAQVQMVKTDANGQASFSYTAVNAGTDTVSASAAINSSNVVSNPVQVFWAPGVHSTFLTLNPSPGGGTVNTPVTVIASLTDLSVSPAAPLSGESVSLTLENDTCIATTDVNGLASCAVTPTTVGTSTLTASFLGNSSYLPSSDSKGFNVSGVAANLSYTGPTTFTNGGAATPSATLTTAQGNSPISGEIITFTLGSGAGAQTCSGTTDTTGTAGCSIGSVNQPTGSSTLTTSFAGDGTYQEASVSTNITISAASVSVPNVVGLTQAAATTAITGAGLVVGTVTTQSSSTVPAGAVISQNPTSGTLVAPGSSVNLVVSTGPPPVPVPNVVGLTQTAASTAITGAGLVVGTVTTQSSSTVPAGAVISQNPTSGTLVAPGSSVNLVVSTGPPPVSVPNVVGLTQTAASTAITGAGLVVGTVTTQSSSTVPAGAVISQNPTSGSLVAPGSSVNLVVSTGPPPTPGKPNIGGSITGKGKDPSGALYLDLKLTDSGVGDAVNVKITQLTLRTLSGSGTVTYNTALSGPLPLTIGNIAVGASTTVRLFFNVPSTVTRFSITENGIVQDTVGSSYNYSIGQSVTP